MLNWKVVRSVLAAMAVSVFSLFMGCSILGQTGDGRSGFFGGFFNTLSGGGQSAIDWMSAWQDQFHSNYYVYYDCDSGGNNFRIMHKTTTYWIYNVNFNCTDNPQSGTSCIWVDIHPMNTGSNVNDVYFLNGVLKGTDIYPEHNMGAIANAGIDLSGATELSFWVRGSANGLKIQFFCAVAGRNDNGSTNYSWSWPDSETRITNNVTLTTNWTEVKIDLTGRNLNYVLNGFGFRIDTNETVGYTDFYIDNIKFNKPRLSEPRFIQSYKPGSLLMQCTSFTYDQALAIMAFLAYGENTRAQYIADALVYAQDHDRYFADGRLRNAYASGNMISAPGWEPNNKIGVVRLPYYGTSEDAYNIATDTGNMAWAMLGLLSYVQKVNPTDQKYIDAVIKLAVWVTNNTYSLSGAGGFTAGTEGWDQNAVFKSYKSTEHNLDLFSVFMRLYSITSDNRWLDNAKHASNFVMAMWNDTEGFFYPGTGNDGVTINTTGWQIPVDCQSWTHLSFRTLDANYQRSMLYADKYYRISGTWGYDFNQVHDGIWYEGTGQMATAYMLLGNQTIGQNIVSEINGGTAPSGAIYATSTASVGTGFYFDYGQWCYFRNEHVGATAWAVFAEKKVNAFWIGTEFEQLNYSGGTISTNTDFSTGVSGLYFTYVPTVGTVAAATAKLVATKPYMYKVMVWILVNGTWWPKPYSGTPYCIPDYATGDTTIEFVTGGYDKNATIIDLLVFPYNYNDATTLTHAQCLADANVVSYCRVARADTTAPAVSITQPVSNLTSIPSTYTLLADVTDDNSIDKVFVVLNGVTNAIDAGVPGTVSKEISVNLELVPGENTVSVFARDYSSQSNYSAAVTRTIVFDANAGTPVVQVTTPSADFTSADYTNLTAISGTATDNESVAAVYISTNGINYYQVTGTANWSTNLKLYVSTSPSTWTNNIYVYAVDNSGISSATNVKKIYYVDVAPPVLTFTNTSGTLYVTNQAFVYLAGTCFDNDEVRTDWAYISSSPSGGPYFNVNITQSNWYVSSVQLQSSSNVVKLNVRDRTGTWGYVSQTIMLLDTIAPTLMLTNIRTNNVSIGMPGEINLTNYIPSISYYGYKTDNLQTSLHYDISNSINVWTSGGLAFEYTTTIQWAIGGYVPGSNQIRFYVTDNGGNTTSTQYVKINVVDTVAPASPVCTTITNNTVVSNKTYLVLNGTCAKDNVMSKNIKISINGSAFTNVTKWTSGSEYAWSYYHLMPAGSNTYRFYSDDYANNCSITNVITLVNIR